MTKAKEMLNQTSFEVRHGVKTMSRRRVEKFSDYQLAEDYMNAKRREGVYADLFALTTVVTVQKLS